MPNYYRPPKNRCLAVHNKSGITRLTVVTKVRPTCFYAVHREAMKPEVPYFVQVGCVNAQEVLRTHSAVAADTKAKSGLSHQLRRVGGRSYNPLSRFTLFTKLLNMNTSISVWSFCGQSKVGPPTDK